MVQAIFNSFVSLAGGCCEANVNKEANETFETAQPLKAKHSAPKKQSSNGSIKMNNESAAQVEAPQKMVLHPLMRGKCQPDRDSNSQCIIIKACDLPEEFAYLAAPKPVAVSNILGKAKNVENPGPQAGAGGMKPLLRTSDVDIDDCDRIRQKGSDASGRRIISDSDRSESLASADIDSDCEEAIDIVSDEE